MCEKLFAGNGWHAGITRASQLEKYTSDPWDAALLWFKGNTAARERKNKREKKHQNKSPNCVKKCFWIPFEKCNGDQEWSSWPQHKTLQ